MKFNTTIVLLGAATISTAASIPTSNDTVLEKREESHSSPGCSAEGFAWSSCSETDKPVWSEVWNGKMEKWDWDPNNESNSLWCWLTKDGWHRQKCNNDGTPPSLGEDLSKSDYSCLTKADTAKKGVAPDRVFLGGCTR
ncbi:hypothetical protein NUU61_003527 [Penicillium alfredii]|uniref:Uncharacterized protein n=1 Tax=Penicillium alfredii TaxID=1506179 RepID=A0A9W9FJH9_9EURO|nr:uncharacterized protein NUU61_003527 [Penicillium alfredii]KAJ5101305.1 hypothetical protein NUU61_003527 [Penicillium alfredii]